jgi:SAM-dependent methyltransferase
VSTAVSILPAWAKSLKKVARKVRYYGNGRYCPLCGKTSRRFRSYGIVPREDAECIHCHALERQRLLWLFLTEKTDPFDGQPKKMLHVAPELCLEPRFLQRVGDGYLTADLNSPRAMVKMDITDIEFPDESFDVIYCSHVLEHVDDDRKAMREFYRVLKTGGWAILLVPITDPVTFEDPSVVDPQERLRVFGQEDHVRRYGPDYVDRLREAGFRVEATTAADLASPADIVRMGLTPAAGEIYFCSK